MCGGEAKQRRPTNLVFVCGRSGSAQSTPMTGCGLLRLTRMLGSIRCFGAALDALAEECVLRSFCFGLSFVMVVFVVQVHMVKRYAGVV